MKRSSKTPIKSYVIKYSIEFFVIMASILISFYIEKQNSMRHDADLKNQSLGRIVVNIEEDIMDAMINQGIHANICEYTETLIERGGELFKNNKDSLGFYFTYAGSASTIFIDNKEEYTTLRNSGFLELIKNDNLVSLLQTKYSGHEFSKELESRIDIISAELDKSINKKTSYKILGSTGGIRTYGSYIDDNPLTNYELKLLRYKLELSNYYVKKIKEDIQNDSNLIEAIKLEIQ